KSYINKILENLDIDEEEVLEIGAGRGELTQYILERAKFLYCVELDLRFFNLLKEKFKNFTNIKIIHSNILELSLSNFEKKLVIFGNIPYQISSSLIKYLVENKDYIKRAYLTFQKEFAHRLLARPKDPFYGFLSCYIQYYARVEKLFDIPKEAFYPSPKVNSSFLKLEFYEKLPYNVKDEDLLFKIIRKAFFQRRKKIINSLFFKDIERVLSELNIDNSKRADDISLKEFVDITNELLKRDNII
ncbi:MAG: 16S rRNA (adenine(1518)-N(6)/adenine(1519)-N(6))-dimethyltransferase RsmA, partial [Candidatus Aenigmatarchaeota archaeon]